MAAPKKKVWKLYDHTAAKHEVLRHYLDAWFPILSSWSGKIVYYDGFAGPGRYERGEIGSPLIALGAARDQRMKLASELVFVFVEDDKARADHLRSEIRKEKLPSNFTYSVVQKSFAEALGEILGDLEAQHLKMAPTFAFIDPFGVKGLPFELIRKLLRHPSCEVLITFMSQAVERWATELPEQIDSLIGVSGAAEQIAASGDRIARAREIYEGSLRSCARFVRFFQMLNVRNRPIYDLFFASNHERGHYRMKEAMWRADASGVFRFSDGADPAQVALFAPDDQAARDFARPLWEHFKRQTVDWSEVQRYTPNLTPYLDKHARGALKLLEQEGGFDGCRVTVAKKRVDGRLRKKNTYPTGARITFVG